ncbi:MAG: hypothetical protein JXB08_00295 [Bacilli bacterium]|nr:hypothetical protein [Bacilli bacterium]MBN2876815.1 hypothetical protein [Bacilli bacterium]
MKKIRPLLYIITLLCIFVVLPVIILIFIYFVLEKSVNLLENFYLIILYGMPLLGIIAYVQQDIFVGINPKEKVIVNNVIDPRPDWNWVRNTDKLIEVEYVKDKYISKSIFGSKYLFSKILLFRFNNGEILYISVSLFTKRQISRIQIEVKKVINYSNL